jgi:hypothetical protein
MRSMKLTLLVLFVCINAHGQIINSGSTGVHGAFNPPSEVPPDTIVTGGNAQSNCTQNAPCVVTLLMREPTPGQPIHANGPHVFNFTTVNIGPNITVRFTRNVANTPVFILATGDVTINGTIDVSGEPSQNRTGNLNAIVTPRGGPGGFDGGTAALGIAPNPDLGGPAGNGPGGGLESVAASFGTGAPSLVYGTSLIQPLIGGSGGAGARSRRLTPFLPRSNGAPGGGGGGAVLIASSGAIDLGSGPGVAITAMGGDVEFMRTNPASSSTVRGWPGSGGAIRLVATSLTGIRSLDARGGRYMPAGSGGGLPTPGDGRIRLESARQLLYSGSTTPAFTKNDNPIFGQPIVVFPPLTPTLRIVSIGGVALPSQPTADANTPDLAIPLSFTNPVAIVVEGRNVPSGAEMEVFASPQFGGGDRVIGRGFLTGPMGGVKTGTISVNLPSTGVGIISAVIRTPVVPEPSGSNNPLSRSSN